MCAICEALGRSDAEALIAHAAPLSADDATAELETFAAGSTASNGKIVYSLDQAVSALDRTRGRWTPGSTVPFQFFDASPAALEAGATFAPLTEIERALTRTAFATIADVINLKFAETTDDGIIGRSSTKISFFLNSAAPSYEWGSTQRYMRGVSGSFNLIANANIEINPAGADMRRWFVGGYNFMADLHEILHALGVSHPSDYNADGSTITYAANATYYQDSRQYTIMSYFDASVTGASYVPPGDNASYSPSTLQLHDIAALQALYGANTTVRAGDTVYGYNATPGILGAYDLAQNPYPIYTIWDGGGTDTLDLSGTTIAERLDLRAGEFSDVLGMKGNVAVAYGVVVENAIGGSGADVIVGNSVANVLRGGAGDDLLTGNGGNDTLDGGAGTDAAVYGGASLDYDWWLEADGSWTVDDGRVAPVDGVDKLIAIEKLTFADKSVDLRAPSIGEAVTAAYRNLLRVDAAGADRAFLDGLTASVTAGALPLADAYKQIAAKALSTTSVATLSYEFFTGMTPTKAGLEYLVSTSGGNANNLNSAYYQSFSTENRYINFAVNLGKLGEGAANFSAAYAASTLFDATRTAYRTVFGTTPTDEKIHAILDPTFVLNGATLTRAEYFAYYGQDGANGIGTKAALVGFLLAEAAKADTGVYALANDAFLLDLADGAHARVDLIGAYAPKTADATALDGHA